MRTLQMLQVIRDGNGSKVDSAVDLAQGIRRALDKAKEFNRSYAVAYPSGLKLVTAKANGRLFWNHAGSDPEVRPAPQPGQRAR